VKGRHIGTKKKETKSLETKRRKNGERVLIIRFGT